MRDYKLRKRVFNEYPTTAEVQKMIAQGGGGGGVSSLVCRILEGTTPENTRLDTQWAVVHQAFVTGKAVIIRIDHDNYSIWSRVVTTTTQPNEYTIVCLGDEGSPAYFDTNSPDGYPKFRET